MPTSRDTTSGETTAGDTTFGDSALTIDCDCCSLRETAACEDCVVTFLLGRDADDAVVIDADEARAMRMLERAGLVPALRFSSRAV
jgi:hypothetical protein